MKTFFVTAIGTDIGKTFVLTHLIAQLQAKGKKVAAIKPVISGFHEGDTDTDVHRIADSLGVEPVDTIINHLSPWRFKESLSPDMAAAHEGRALDTHELVDYCRHSMRDAQADYFFVEGIGGVMVPLNTHTTVLALIQILQIPCLVVAGTYLGSLNHTLLTLNALKHAQVPVAGVVVSASGGNTPNLAATMASISHFSDVPMIGIPRLGLADHVPDLTALVEGELAA